MAIKLGNKNKAPGDNWIGFGGVLCFLTVVIFLMGAFNGVNNGLTLAGGVLMGLIMISIGYLKRISVALMQNTSATKESASI
ncbi:hypothetical protein GU243_02380 [Pseudarthrobacter psychrotolerans]|uniref:Uncharacterized protein n=1 Tax=Pseudarthrobacter psychrotolerans TaxID=2697569 RepID=A0A6P1NPV4_9MICC|nr:hypothetical protein [Pseudarthrobacter psychrotolerans]QHK18811.1 hypothetical protein GU243_02380 [Pseudarthrobacter psychrotolerans]